MSRMQLEEKIREALKNVHDPEIGINIVDLGLIYKIEIRKDSSAFITMTMTSPFCPAAGMITDGVKKWAESVEGITKCEIEITFDPPWSPEKMSEDAREELGVSMDIF
jgi:metal-sulfur cluster biosynthetic enzyme